MPLSMLKLQREVHFAFRARYSCAPGPPGRNFDPHSTDSGDKLQIIENALCARRGPGTVHQAILDRESIDEVLEKFELSADRTASMLNDFKLERQPRNTRWRSLPKKRDRLPTGLDQGSPAYAVVLLGR
jgi:hypothetical protein